MARVVEVWCRLVLFDWMGWLVFERGWDNELGSGVVFVRDSAVVVHFGSPVGVRFVLPDRVVMKRKKWWL